MRTMLLMAVAAWVVVAQPLSAHATSDKLDIPLNIAEVAGVNRSADLVSSGVPLPAGLLAEPTDIAVFDPSGKAVPAQFAVTERWREHGQDGSVKWLVVMFFADVPAGGTAVYRLRAGTNPTPAQAARPVDGLGPFRLTLTDPQGRQITDADVKDVRREVVEAGPVRACVKLESPSSHETFGYIAWIYSFADTDRCDAIIVLKNTPDKPLGPFYFRDFAVSVASPSMESAKNWLLGGEPAIGENRGKPFTGELGQSALLYQDSDGSDRWQQVGSQPGRAAIVMDWSKEKTYEKAGIPRFRGFRVQADGKQLGEGNYALGWSGLTDGKRSAMLAVRHFRENYPTAAEVRRGTLIARLLPGQWEGHGGLHWLDDTQRKRWDVSYRPIDGKLDSAAGDMIAMSFNMPLVIHPGLEWLARSGVVGLQPDARIDPRVTAVKPYPFSYGAEPGWVVFGGDTSDRIRRRYHQYPMTPFLTGADPAAAWRVMIGAYHSSAMTVMWLDDYQYPRDKDVLSVRQYCSPARPAGKYRDGTRHHGYCTWNMAHFCCQELFDAWRLFADPLAMMAIRDVTTYQRFYVDYRLAGGDLLAGTRSDGHPLSNLAEAYRLTGEKAVFESLAQLATKAARDQVNKTRGNYGTMPSWEGGQDLCEKPFMMSQVMDGLREYHSLTGDEQVRDQIIGMVDFILAEAMLHDHEGIYGFTYVVKLADPKLQVDYLAERLPEARKNPGTGPGQLNPRHIIFAFEQTGQARYYQVLERMLPAIYRAHGDNRRRFAWLAAWLEANKERAASARPPAEVADLAAEPLGEGKVRLTWTTPANAARLQVKFADRPIVEKLEPQADADRQWPWWSAEHIPSAPPAQPGRKQSIIVEDVPAGQRHFAIRCFDAASNRSAISNIATATVR